MALVHVLIGFNFTTQKQKQKNKKKYWISLDTMKRLSEDQREDDE